MNGSLKSTLVFLSFSFFSPLFLWDQVAASQTFFQMGTKPSSEAAFEDVHDYSAQSTDHKTVYVYCEAQQELLTE